jgi:hypothetical protein
LLIESAVDEVYAAETGVFLVDSLRYTEYFLLLQGVDFFDSSFDGFWIYHAKSAILIVNGL